MELEYFGVVDSFGIRIGWWVALRHDETRRHTTTSKVELYEFLLPDVFHVMHAAAWV